MSSRHPERLRALMLKAAVEDNVETIAGRLPRQLRSSRWHLHLWSRLMWVAAATVGVVFAAVGVARWPASAHAASITASSPETGAAIAVRPGPPGPAVVSQAISPDVLALGVRRVVVDAGHGGENLGTSGVGGLVEKNLTLDIAERVRQLVVRRGFEAVMTRTTDETLTLRQRVGIANEQRGDIFVSLHLNSIRPSSAGGVETYYLGPTDDPERDSIAAAENQQPGYSLSDMRSLLEKLYTDARRDESRRLAESVQHALVRTLRKVDPALTDRGVKMAPFVVLVGTQMPAILAEVSCLSSTREAERLDTAEYRQTIAEALVSGIEAFASEAAGSRAERRAYSGS